MRGTDRQRGGSMGISIGSATLVMLYAVLCLTIFSVMALVTANQEWKLAQKSADAVTAYYAADSRAAEVYNDLRAACSATLDGVEIDGVTLSEQNNRLTYEVPVDEMQTLQVELVWSEQTGWEVSSWKVGQTGQWKADESLTVWNGE